MLFRKFIFLKKNLIQILNSAKALFYFYVKLPPGPKLNAKFTLRVLVL